MKQVTLALTTAEAMSDLELGDWIAVLQKTEISGRYSLSCGN